MRAVRRAASAFAVIAGLACYAMAPIEVAAAPATAAQTSETRPNFLIIVADDLGFSDLECFGGEVQSPNITALAASGVRMTNFHSAPACSPTRSQLLTGVDHHLAGIGAMAETNIPASLRAMPTYAGRLRKDIPTVAEMLRAVGYQTFLTGKWHLGSGAGEKPVDRGFDRSVTLLSGGGGSFANAFATANPAEAHKTATGEALATPYYEDDRPMSGLPKDFYSTDFYTQKLMEMLKARDKDRPFFAYLAFQAPHWPLQAPKEIIAKYHGHYDGGPDRLLIARLKRMNELGIVPKSVAMGDFVSTLPKWDTFTPEEKAIAARKMEVYAAMVDRIDEQLGRLFAQLKSAREMDNTFILFMSDNGAEGGEYAPIKLRSGGTYGDLIARHFDNRLDSIGNENSLVWIGPDWAHASTAPFNLFKAFATEGGTRVPAIVKFPGVNGRNAVSPTFATVLDVVPTILSLARIPAPPRASDVPPIEGRSLTAHFIDGAPSVHDDGEIFGWELHGDQSVRKGRWKAVRTLDGENNRGLDLSAVGNRWRLFDIVADPGEAHDLATKQPAKLKEMEAAWESYAKRAGVQPWPNLPLVF